MPTTPPEHTDGEDHNEDGAEVILLELFRVEQAARQEIHDTSHEDEEDEIAQVIAERRAEFSREADAIVQSLIDNPSPEHFSTARAFFQPLTVDGDISIQTGAVQALRAIDGFEERRKEDLQTIRSTAARLIIKLEEEKAARKRGGVSNDHIICRGVESIYFTRKDMLGKLERGALSKREVFLKLESIYKGIISLKRTAEELDDEDLMKTALRFEEGYANDENEAFRKAWLEFLSTPKEEREKILAPPPYVLEPSEKLVLALLLPVICAPSAFKWTVNKGFRLAEKIKAARAKRRQIEQKED